PGDCVQYNRRLKTVYVANDDGTSVWAVDETSMSIKGTATIHEAPEYMEIDSKRDLAYQAIKSTSTVQTIDLKAMKVTAEWKLGSLTSPH
ncbi:hypothetical protein ABTM12_19655, partial [Acinetobacter baumannii]